MELLFLILGLGILWMGAELVVNGISSIANHYKISPFFLGLTLLAVGTDLPETFIVIFGAIEQRLGVNTSSLLIGEIIGSSVSQISLILGITGLLGLVVIQRKKMFRDGIMLVVSVILLFLILVNGRVDWYEGVILLLAYAMYVITLLKGERHYKLMLFHQQKFSIRWSIVSLFGGFLLLAFSSHFTLENALVLSSNWGLQPVLVGSLIVGLGTSLPELITAYHAVRKKVSGLAIGGLIGSNIYDTLVPIGIGSLISPLQVPLRVLYFDTPFLFFISSIVLLFLRKDYTMSLRESAILIGIYLTYFIIQLTWI